MHNPNRSQLTRAALLASVCLAVSIAHAAPEPASPPPAVASSNVPANPPASPPAAKPEDRGAQWRADRAAFFEARLAALHAGLQLNPTQDALWTPVETAIRGFAKLRADRWAAMTVQRTDDQAAKGAGVTDRLRRLSDRLIARGQAMKTLADAAAPLTASLDATQKDRLPRLLEGLKPRHVLDEAFALETGEGWRRGDRGRMEHHGMRNEQDGRDQGEREPDWRHQRGYAERDGMRDRREDGDRDGAMPMHRHHHHDDEDGSDRT